MGDKKRGILTIMHVKVMVTVREVLDHYDWCKFCEIVGLDVWSCNEGTCQSDEVFSLSQDEAAQIGIKGF